MSSLHLYSLEFHFRCCFQFEDDVGLLWRLARALFHLSNHVEQERDTEGQKQLVQEGGSEIGGEMKGWSEIRGDWEFLIISLLPPLSSSALEQCERGLEVDDGVWEVHQWYAIAIGSLTKYEGTQRKIEMGYKYKVGGQSLSPLPPSLYHSPGAH